MACFKVIQEEVLEEFEPIKCTIDLKIEKNCWWLCSHTPIGQTTNC